jgi:DNA repair protein RadD
MISLRPYQTECIDALYNWFQTHDGNPLLCLPTGSGKSLIQAKIFEDAMQWTNQRVLSVTHIHELISQNYQQLHRIWPEAPAGIYSAGLGKKQSRHPIIFAGIQSVYKKAETIGFRDLVCIDEAHLLGDSDDGMYRKFLADMKMINPDLKIVGLTATAYRLKSGYLHKGKNALFNDIAFELPLIRLVKEGYLTALVNKAAEVQGNTEKIGLQGGDFALRAANTEFDRQEMTRSAVDEMIAKGANRRSWLVFCILKEHAEHVREALQEKGVPAASVTDDTPTVERARILRDFKDGHIRAITNVGVLTTGFDAPNIDMIAMLRPTMSPGLLVQMLGRGMRPVYMAGADLSTIEGRLVGIAGGPKSNCYVLDFAGNLDRHGPVTHIRPPDGTRKDKKDKDGKMCLSCRSINELTAMECADCGKPFATGLGTRVIKHSMKAARQAVMSDAPVMGDQPVWLDVKKIHFDIHDKPGKPSSLRVDYNCSPNHVSEWICIGHTGLAKSKADQWWRARGGLNPVPEDAEEAWQRLEEIAHTRTVRVKARKNGKYAEVLSYDLSHEETVIHKPKGNLGSRSAMQFAKEKTDDVDATPETESVAVA